MSSIIGILIFIIIILVYSLNHNNKKQHIAECVAWCTSEDSRLYRNNLQLHEYVHNEQLKHNLDPIFKLYLYEDGPDKQFTKEILIAYQNNLHTIYASGAYAQDKIVSKLTEEDFFWYSLHDFLLTHSEKYGLCEKPLYHHQNKLTDFGFVFHKLYYISKLSTQRRKICSYSEWYIDSSKNTVLTREF